MSLLAVKRKFIISLTILMVVLSWGGALVFHTLLPRYYFAWYHSCLLYTSDEFFRVRVATQSRVAECEDKAAHSERE